MFFISLNIRGLSDTLNVSEFFHPKFAFIRRCRVNLDSPLQVLLHIANLIISYFLGGIPSEIIHEELRDTLRASTCLHFKCKSWSSSQQWVKVTSIKRNCLHLGLRRRERSTVLMILLHIACVSPPAHPRKQHYYLPSYEPFVRILYTSTRRAKSNSHLPVVPAGDSVWITSYSMQISKVYCKLR